MKIRKYFLAIGFIFLVSFSLSERQISEPIEKLAIHSGIGYDTKKTVEGLLEYNIPISVYVINANGNVTSKVYTGKASNLPRTRENRQRKLDRRFIVGFEKVYIIGENAAKEGIRPLIDILMKSQWINDNGYTFVCKGNTEDLMKLKIEGYPSSSDFLDGMMDSITSHDFFGEDYFLINIIQTVDAEGKKTMLPYIELNQQGQPEITGIVIFNKGIMVRKLNVQDMRMMNMIRNNKSYGIVNIEKNSKEYVGFETTIKRKVKCSKEDDRFEFIINLTLNGNVINNQLYPGMDKNPTLQKEFEEDLSKKVKSQCEDFINKMKSQYKIDLLNLSEVAIAKYGRHTGVNWDESVSKAKIEVNVKVKVDLHLRGEYTE